MPRALILCLGLLAALHAEAQGSTVVPVWKITGPESVTVGEPFIITAEVRLPAGYYQDADSAFLEFEPTAPAVVTARSSSAPSLRAGKSSYTNTFTLTRTLVLPEASLGSLSIKIGWQICKVDGVCLLPVEETRSIPLVLSGSSRPFWEAWAAAFLGGLLLNLMPCVFPVLALKGLGLAALAQHTRTRRRREAFAFASGTFFTVLGLGLATAGVAALGQRLDWGFPFQQPLFVAALALVFGAFSLQLLGILRWKSSPFSLTLPAAPGLAQSWWGGSFLVLAAAPCTAPVLGPALGFALTRPPLEIPVYFALIGLGLAAPLLVLQLFPHWTKLLPKPGRWMTVVEKIAAGFLAATTIYLVWIVLTLLPFSQPDLRGWKPYSPEALKTALSEGHPVLIDATASWCATCQVNEWAVLNKSEVIAELDRLGVVRLRADYTRPNAVIHEWLKTVERAGLPVYALYRPGHPVYLFPELLTDQNFTQELPRLLAP